MHLHAYICIYIHENIYCKFMHIYNVFKSFNCCSSYLLWKWEVDPDEGATVGFRVAHLRVHFASMDSHSPEGLGFSLQIP